MLYSAGSVHDLSVDAADLCGLTWLGGELWFADPVRRHVVPVDPESGSARPAVPCPGLRSGLATLHGHLLYAVGEGSELRVVDPESGAVVASLGDFRPGEPVTGMESGRHGIWLGFRDSVELRSTPHFDLLRRLPAPLGVTGVTVTDRYLVFSDSLGETITVVDLLTERTVLSIRVDGRPTGITWDGTRLWYCDANYLRLRAIEVPGMVSEP
jgi:hypothetical protein